MKFTQGLLASLFAALAPLSLAATNFSISEDVFSNESLRFKPHHGAGRFGSYLSMEIQYSPVKKLFNELDSKLEKKLKNRGEAHITVVTPIEFFDYLKPANITIEEIDKIAKKNSLQHSKFDIICVGRGQLEISGAIESTYYVVVESDNLMKIRRDIETLYKKRGGMEPGYKASHYYPHITLGFTARDLHESDGVIKDKDSCVYPLSIK